uniref:homeobox protein Hox-A6 isoform X4 n=1 Tax=Jaculus jaculus TaxID=51337 RepID=UPI001E1B56D6|nr:homeobox protein Hox-A6 isoform X4 [Jaculus jaculus]
MWIGTVNMNFFIISLARIEPHSFASLGPACFGALPSRSLPGLRFVRRWRGKGGLGRGPARRSRGRWAAPGARRRSLTTRNLANFLRPLAPARRTVRLPGGSNDSCQRDRSFWEPHLKSNSVLACNRASYEYGASCFYSDKDLSGASPSGGGKQRGPGDYLHFSPEQQYKPDSSSAQGKALPDEGTDRKYTSPVYPWMQRMNSCAEGRGNPSAMGQSGPAEGRQANQVPCTGATGAAAARPTRATRRWSWRRSSTSTAT